MLAQALVRGGLVRRVDTDTSRPKVPAKLVVGGSFCAVLLAGGAVIRFGGSVQGWLWAAAQVLLVFVAGFDLATRRVPNRVTIPAAIAVVVLRAAFAPSAVPSTLVAGAAAFAFFLLVFVLTRGGIGMGDVKLAALVGVFLGRAALPALLIGTIAGGLASLVVLLARRGGRGQTIAYAPYLCFGAALAILAFKLPELV
jgi:leader peptidase (prepilin peptidase) / N-methyltransferase